MQATGEVEVWLHADDSCMATTQGGRFVQHFIPGEQDPRLYAGRGSGGCAAMQAGASACDAACVAKPQASHAWVSGLQAVSAKQARLHACCARRGCIS